MGETVDKSLTGKEEEMKKKQSENRESLQTGTSKKTSISIKRDKVAVKKSAKNDGAKKEQRGIVRSATKSWFVWEIVIPVGIVLFSIIFFVAQWFVGIFTRNANEIIWITVAVFGIGGATTGWLWKRGAISAVIGGVIGMILGLACATFLDNLVNAGPCFLGC